MKRFITALLLAAFGLALLAAPAEAARKKVKIIVRPAVVVRGR